MNSPSLMNAQPLGSSILDITLSNAVKDSPFFRASVHHFEDEVEELTKWMESTLKLLRLYCEGYEKINEMTMLVSNKITNYDEEELFGEH